KAARDFYRYYLHEKGDWAAAKNMIDTFSLEINARAIPTERVKAYQEAFIAGLGGFPLISTKEQIGYALQALSRSAIYGVLLCWLGVEPGVGGLGDGPDPRVRQAGLRDFG